MIEETIPHLSLFLNTSHQWEILREVRLRGKVDEDAVIPTATDAMREFYRRNSHLFDEIRYRY